MNHPDNSSQSTETACAQTIAVRTIAPEQLRKFLNDRRNRLQETRRALLCSAAQLKDEIAAIDAIAAILADLIIG